MWAFFTGVLGPILSILANWKKRRLERTKSFEDYVANAQANTSVSADLSENYTNTTAGLELYIDKLKEEASDITKEGIKKEVE